MVSNSLRAVVRSSVLASVLGLGWSLAGCAKAPCGAGEACEPCQGADCQVGPDACTPVCQNKTCGPDGCGGTCGSCGGHDACTDAGVCIPPGCVPQCTGKHCGSDGCNGVCGTCTGTDTCSGAGVCVPPGCVPQCAGHQCGPDGCGGACGAGCTATQNCNGVGQCEDIVDPHQAAPVLGVDICQYSRIIGQPDFSCLRKEGIKHVVVGMQDPYMSLRQIDEAHKAGMLVDAYMWVFWNKSVADQVTRAKTLLAGKPVRRLWLDVEDPNTGGKSAKQLEADIRAGLDACGTLSCGIYSAWGFWTTYLVGITSFTDVPLWYAHYDDVQDLSDWATTPFGNWTVSAINGKQYHNTMGMCQGINTVRDIFYDQVPKLDDLRPLTPTGLSPAQGQKVNDATATLSWTASADVGSYEVQLWYEGGSWSSYWSETTATVGTAQLALPYPDTRYLWRVRGVNGHGTGTWSDFATFDYGTPATPGTGVPPPPRGMFPRGGVDFCSGDDKILRISVDAWPNAVNYQYEIQNWSGTTWVAYQTYTKTANVFLLSPQFTPRKYRYRVRVSNASGWGTFSDWSEVNWLGLCPAL